MLATRQNLPRQKTPHPREWWLGAAFLLLVIIVFVIRGYVYVKYSMQVIDGDQPYMWLGARHFYNGLFYEARYYGQNYNTYFEALVAVPFMWFKVPVYYAVPAATHLVSVFPFVFGAVYLFFKRKQIQAMLVLTAVICLPASYDLLNSIPRGFVTGLFFCSFFIVNFLNPERFGVLFFNTAMAVTAFFVNPNSILVSIPFLFYMFLCLWKQKKYYVVTIAALLLFWPLHLFFDGLYIKHPEYVMHGLEYRVSPSFFIENISNLDQRFAHISFFFENNCLALLFSIAAIITILIIQKNYKAASTVCFFLLLICIAFFSGKTTEGSTWVYMSFSRMYLGIPLLLCLMVSQIKIPVKKTWLLLLIVPVLFACYKLGTMEKKLARNFDDRRWIGIMIYKVDAALDAISVYKKSCDRYNEKLLVIARGFWLYSILSHGGPAVDPDFPETLESKLEKRYWVRDKYLDAVVPHFMYLSSTLNLPSEMPATKDFELENIDGYGLVRVKNNTVKTSELLRRFQEHEYFY